MGGKGWEGVGTGGEGLEGEGGWEGDVAFAPLIQLELSELIYLPAADRPWQVRVQRVGCLLASLARRVRSLSHRFAAAQPSTFPD